MLPFHPQLQTGNQPTHPKLSSKKTLNHSKGTKKRSSDKESNKLDEENLTELHLIKHQPKCQTSSQGTSKIETSNQMCLSDLYNPNPNQRKSSEDPIKTTDLKVARKSSRKGDSKSKQSRMKLFEGSYNLGKILSNQKVGNIVHTFVSKLKRNLSKNKPPKDFKFEDQESHAQTQFTMSTRGLQLPAKFFAAIAIIKIIIILSLSVMFSLALVFVEVEQSLFLRIAQIMCLVFFCFEFCLNLTTNQDSNITNLEHIWKNYLMTNYWTDLFMVVIFIMILSFRESATWINLLRLLIILKWPQLVKEISSLQLYSDKSLFKRQYWELTKIFCFMIGYAHVLATILISLTQSNEKANWLLAKGIALQEWYMKYIWSYYFASTMIFTIGFGEVTAVSPQEAIVVLLIEIISFFVLVYNAIRVGSLFLSLYSHHQQKQQSKIIRMKLIENSSLSSDLTSKINCASQESFQIKEKFDILAQQKFISELPLALKTEYIKQANLNVLGQIQFFRPLYQHSFNLLAQKVQRKICYPQEIVKSLQDDFHLIILQFGSLGYVCKQNLWSNLNGRIFNSVSVSEKDKPFLTSLDFIHKKRSFHQIISLEYSTIYFVEYESLIQSLSSSKLDYQNYCYERDKIKNIPDQFQVMKCQSCATKHLKIACPKIHYLPYEQQVINKHLFHVKVDKNPRIQHQRNNHSQLKPFDLYQHANNHAKSTSKTHPSQKLPSHSLQNSKVSHLQQDHQINHYAVDLDLLVKKQFQRFGRKSTTEDNVWLLEMDKLYDYRFYFLQNNPESIGARCEEEKRKRRN